MKKILVVNVNWLGDAILTTPIFKALKEKFPSSYLAVMLVERVKDIFKNNPYIDEIIVFDEKTIHRTIKAKIKFIKYLREKKFDLAFLIHRSFTKAFICFLAGIKERIGYKRFKNIFVLSKKILPPNNKIMHRQDYYFYLFEKLGIEINDRTPKVFVKEELRTKYKEFFKSFRKDYKYLVGVNPSGNWEPKRWGPKNFAKVCNTLIEELNCGVFFIGDKKDSLVVDSVIKLMNKRSYNLCGMTSLEKLIALLENFNLFLSNDSGPAHISASLGVPTLVIFGPTSPLITSPKGKIVKTLIKDVGCVVPCYRVNCKDNKCIEAITPEEVLQEIKIILKNVQ